MASLEITTKQDRGGKASDGGGWGRVGVEKIIKWSNMSSTEALYMATSSQ